jgi:hypothetical protein
MPSLVALRLHAHTLLISWIYLGVLYLGDDPSRLLSPSPGTRYALPTHCCLPIHRLPFHPPRPSSTSPSSRTRLPPKPPSSPTPHSEPSILRPVRLVHPSMILIAIVIHRHPSPICRRVAGSLPPWSAFPSHSPSQRHLSPRSTWLHPKKIISRFLRVRGHKVHWCRVIGDHVQAPRCDHRTICCLFPRFVLFCFVQ